MQIPFSERIRILSARLENLKSNTNSEMTIEERVEMIKDCESALRWATEERARADSLR